MRMHHVFRLILAPSHWYKTASFLMVTAWLVGTSTSQAQNGDFHNGRKIDMLIGVDTGGLYDLQSRLIGRFIGQHIPGHPGIIPQNMPGAGGVKMASWLSDLAPKDGTAIGAIPNSFPFMQTVGLEDIKFDVGKFQWIGSIAPLVGVISVTDRSGIKSIEDSRNREVIVGASGVGGDSYTMAAMFNAFAGTKFKIITGYKGGNDINLAMERGELDGRYNFWTSWKSTRPDWIKSGFLRQLAYIGPAQPDLPNIPSILDLIQDPSDRSAVELVMSGARLGTPLAAPPGVAKARMDILRTAFTRTMKDPNFLAEAEKMKIEVDPVMSTDIERIVGNALATPKHIAARARILLP
jgi:tripartite-type tricarboxylate transporter receptor subunit TctC